MRERGDQHRTSGLNRRAFLQGSGAAVAATALAETATEAVAQESSRFKSGPQTITLNINGQDHELTVEPRATLRDVLRNDLNLTGCKEVEDASVIGADTVIVDGKAVMAGALLAIQCKGKIETVESLRDGNDVDEVIAGFVKHDATQCGYCTPGFVMATRAFLNANPNASLEDIRKGLGGNACRCGTYVGITACALEIAKGGE